MYHKQNLLILFFCLWYTKQKNMVRGAILLRGRFIFDPQADPDNAGVVYLILTVGYGLQFFIIFICRIFFIIFIGGTIL